MTVHAAAPEKPAVDIWGAQRKSRLLEKRLTRKLAFEWRPTAAPREAEREPAVERAVERGESCEVIAEHAMELSGV